MAVSNYRPALTERNKHCFFVCEHCGKDSHRRLSGTAKDKGYTNKYCSMDCRVKAGAINKAARERVRRELAAIRTMGRRIRANDERRRKEGIKRIITVLTDRLHSMLPPLLCPDCGVPFNKERDNRKERCEGCMRERSREVQRKWKKTPNGRALRSLHKAKRRARKNIDSEPIDPIYILNRDKWICQLCGVRTPKTKRGSYDDDAPEVDHIISLAEGGSHTKANLQCACRSCNIKKGAKSMGQMRLA